MSVNLIKLCVGIDDIDHLARVQQARLETARANGEPEVLRHVTRNMPRRRDEVLDGGSLFWVIRRVILVRQRIVGLESVERDDGRPACAIILDPEHVRTMPRRFRAFQGWRYFPPDDAPPDLSEHMGVMTELPAEMAAELRDLGLI
ncbi:MAG: DUF1489 domain-containing protein [Magnetovibrio sp.]|nr:DUF1489 domain-containing protein [Magnetovibrio sp.]